jgi:plasmid replication initiation protein
MAKNDKSLIVSRKPNKIIESRQSLSVVQHRILFSVFAQFRTKIANTKIETAKDYKEIVQTIYSVKLSDIILDLKKQKDSKALFNHIEKECKNILKQMHEVSTDDGWEAYNLVDYAKFYRNELKLEVRIAASMIELILRWFRNGFTQIPLKEILPLRSKYSIRIFEILLRVMNIPGVKEDGYTISYEELRKRLGILAEEYRVYYDFEKRVLQQSQKEIHEKTFMRFEYRKELERFPYAINIRFSNITHKVEEILPAQLEIFDFEKQETDRDEQVIKNATVNLNFIENSRRKNITVEREWTEADRKWQREIEDDIIKSISPKKYKDEDYEINKFTEEQLIKLEKYLDGIFSADEIKYKYEFDYIEFYYNKAIDKNNKGTLKDFAGFLYSLLIEDKYKFYELKAKEEAKKAKEIERRKAEKEKREREKEQERIQKEKEAADIKRRVALFDSLDDKLREKYLEEFYAKNPFYKSVLDKKGISEFTKISVGGIIESKLN